MTLDRIRELLREADTAKPGYIDATWDSDLLDAALPLLRRWTDPTPITPEAMSAARGWYAQGRYWERGFAESESCLTLSFLRDGTCIVHHWDQGNSVSCLGSPRTLGQLDRLVDAIEVMK